MRWEQHPAIVSWLYVLKNGASTEIAMVGVRGAKHGATLPFAFGGVQGSIEPLGHHLLLRYTQALITQMAQTAVCNCHHLLA